jgi:hypothetical protein
MPSTTFGIVALVVCRILIADLNASASRLTAKGYWSNRANNTTSKLALGRLNARDLASLVEVGPADVVVRVDLVLVVDIGRPKESVVGSGSVVICGAGKVTLTICTP